MRYLKHIVGVIALGMVLLSFSSCGEYLRVQRSTNTSLKYSYAKKYYNQGKYSRVVDLLQQVVPEYDGTAEGGQAIYMLADAYYHTGDAEAASDFFKRFYHNYPSDPRAEEAMYKSAIALFEGIPDPRLDQSLTYLAMQEMQAYLDKYPQSDKRNDMRQKMFDLQDHLAEKELLAAKLYYDLGMYMGNNFESSIIIANNALKDYPYTKHKEEFLILILRASFNEAENSIEAKMPMRYRATIDRYYDYKNAFPQGKYTNEAQKIFEACQKRVQ